MHEFKFIIKYKNGEKERYCVGAVLISTAWLRVIIDLRERHLTADVISITLRKDNENEEN